MSQILTITGVTVAAGSAQTLQLATLLLPPIKSILKADQIINPHTHVFAGTSATPAGTVAAPTFTGAALATHTHDMRIIGGQGAAGTDTVTCPTATDILGKQEAGDADVLGVNAATVGGVMVVTAGTPAGTNSAPAFTGTAATPAGTNAAAQPTRAALTIVTVTPTGAEQIQRVGDTTLSMWLTTAMTANDILVLTIEGRGDQVRP